MSKRRLPVLVEQAVGSVQAEGAAKGAAFERSLRARTRLTCQPGCHHCCSHPLEISVFEAIPIYRYLVARGRWTPSFVQTLDAHSNATNFISPPVWLLTQISCPVLSDGRCSIYEVRPVQCRVTWANGDPHYCHGQRFGPETSLLARDELMGDFLGYERLLANQVGLPFFTVPISRALLLAEQLVTGRITLSDLTVERIEDYRRSG